MKTERNGAVERVGMATEVSVEQEGGGNSAVLDRKETRGQGRGAEGATGGLGLFLPSSADSFNGLKQNIHPDIRTPCELLLFEYLVLTRLAC